MQTHGRFRPQGSDLNQIKIGARIHLFHHLVETLGMFGKHQSIDLNAGVQFTQRTTGLDIPQVRSQDQRAFAGSDLPFAASAIHQPNVMQFPTPACQLIEHRIAETHEVTETVERCGQGSLPALCELSQALQIVA
ncbi:hypothetical protein D3C79_837880 [compost metagenome]